MKSNRILLVEHSAQALKTLAGTLNAAGYQVLLAEDGAAAVSTARRERPDLILLTIDFPPDVAHGGGVSWDGFVILGWMRRIDELKDTPVVIMGEKDSPELVAKARAAGAKGYFPKSREQALLLGIVGQLLPEPEAMTSDE